MKHRIPENIIEEIRSRADIVDVVSDYVPLKRSGKDYKGLCPFHSEKTPSFTVSQNKQIYYCFGCSRGGNVFKFLMEIEDLPYVEAVKKLASRTNVPIPVPRGGPAGSPSEREALLQLNRLAADYFHSLLNHPDAGQAAKAYINSRHLDEPTLKNYQLGWASPAWRDLIHYLGKKKGFPLSQLEKAGLIKKKDGGGSEDFYDRFRSRIIFPIRDVFGNIVAFGGRVIADEEPKYLNSPETGLYKKGHHLFGMDRARQAIRNEDHALVVEGYFDQIRASQHGIQNVVATCGTALTRDQIGLLRKFTRNVILIFDSDAAGKSATDRGFDLLLEEGMNVRIVTLPDGHDPDSFILEHGAEPFLKETARARHYVEVFIQNTVRSGDVRNPAGRLKIANEVLPLLARIKSNIERSEWVRYLSEQTGVEDRALMKDLKKSLARKSPVVRSPESERPNKPDPEVYLIHLMLSDEEAARTIRSQVAVEEFQEPGLRRIAEVLYSLIDEGRTLRLDRAVDRTESSEIKGMLTKIGLELITFDNPAKAAADCIRGMRKKNVETRIKELKQQRDEAEKAGESTRSRELHNQVRTLQVSLLPG